MTHLFYNPQISIGDGLYETRRYACVVSRPVVTRIPIYGLDLSFRSGCQELGRLYPDGELVIKDGYACDGYSPTIRFFGSWIRLTPIPKRAKYFPAIFHDFTRQFVNTDGCPWTSHQSDMWFYDLLVSGGENRQMAGTYFGAVNGLAGMVFTKLTGSHDPSLRITSNTETS